MEKNYRITVAPGFSLGLLFFISFLSAQSLWQPPVGTTWQWQLQGTIDRSFNVTMYDVDLFDTDTSVISALHADGRIVIGYFSAGSSENWRPDFAGFNAADMGNNLEDWAGEKWLDTRSANVRDIMKRRLDLAVSKGFDGVEPDNVDGYTNNPGFPLTAATQLDYLKFLAHEAHVRGLSVGLKNALDLIPSVVDSFDWALNEQCLQYNECNAYQPFIDRNKAVFHCEYENTAASVCPVTAPLGLSSILKDYDLLAPTTFCTTYAGVRSPAPGRTPRIAGFTLFPSPVNNDARISVSGGTRLQVFTAAGQTVLDRKLSGTEGIVYWNCGMEAPGIYLISLQTPEGMVTGLVAKLR